METATSTKSGVDREAVSLDTVLVIAYEFLIQYSFLQTCPFLLRTFVKVNGFHSISLFDENKLPVEDEHQLYTWYMVCLSLLRSASIYTGSLSGRTPR